MGLALEPANVTTSGTSFQTFYYEVLQDYRLTFWGLVICAFVLVLSVSQFHGLISDDLPTVNRLFPGEPSLFIRLRWALFAPNILDDAYKKFRGEAYRLARGDTDFIVLPPRFISELNALPKSAISSRKSHVFSLLGELTGVNIVRVTSYHVKILLGRISPNIAARVEPIAGRMSKAMTCLFPQQTDSWSVVGPLNLLVQCISEGITMTLFGQPICDNPELIRLCHEHTKDVFIVAFCMRFIPACLQSTLVYLLPAKWRLLVGWKAFKRIVEPEINRRRQLTDFDATESGDLVSWIIQDAKNPVEKDAWVLTQLSASVAAGATYSTANFVAQALADMVAHPDVLDQVRAEIHTKHIDIQTGGGRWDLAALNDLPKLESAMKETARLSPGTLLIYSRLMEEDHTLSNGLTLRQGRFITTASQAHNTANETMFPDPKIYKGLRFYEQNLAKHRAQPFYSLDSDILTWGSGRWACPGRYVANLSSRVLLIKLLGSHRP